MNYKYKIGDLIRYVNPTNNLWNNVICRVIDLNAGIYSIQVIKSNGKIFNRVTYPATEKYITLINNCPEYLKTI
jgi:hypothetical protein